MNLNDSQTRAVEHFDGPCLVLAGPGSGKTAVLTLRINRLLERGVRPERICVITFTKAAANEMAERFLKINPGGRSVVFATFHSLFWKVLMTEKGYSRDSIIMGLDRARLIRESGILAGISGDEREVFNALSVEISNLKNQGISPEDYHCNMLDSSLFKRAYEGYEDLKRQNHVVDFDDMLTLAYELFLEDERALSAWRDRFDYFLVDEAQDMNELQFKLITMLCANNNNIFCVGDDDQSIYGFRGASPELLRRFTHLYPDCKRLLLDVNYRCPSNVVSKALNLISNNKDRFHKDIRACKEEGSIELLKAQNPKTEASNVLFKIKELREAGLAYENMAVLYRNHSEANHLVAALINENVPFYLKDRMPNIYTHYIVEDIMDYFQIAVGNATRERMLKVINKPNRYIQRAAFENGYSERALKDFYKNNSYMYQRVEEFFVDIKLISKMHPLAAMTYLRAGVGYERYLRENCLEKGTDFDELVEVFEFIEGTIKDCPTIKKAIDKISFLRLKVDYENKALNASREGKLGLYTLHSSKGLEFDATFIIGLNEGILPGKRADSQAELEAERRLFYVGLTRAKERLYLSYVDEKNRNRMYPSRFINELNIEDYS